MASVLKSVIIIAQRRQNSRTSGLILVKGKCPANYVVMHSNETHDVHFQLKDHNPIMIIIAIISAGMFFTVMLDVSKMRETISVVLNMPP